MRQIVLDTETTGIGHEHGHRIIEIGCLELVSRQLTGQHFHVYLNPERAVDEGAFRVHGLSNDFLQDKPLFKDVFNDLLTFIDDAELIIHNAPFDVGFLNAEFKHLQYGKKIEDHCDVLDTLVLAKQKHPGQRNNLDALCKRYSIDNTNREWHGALLDAELLAQVYLAMTGGQTELFAQHSTEEIPIAVQTVPLTLVDSSLVHYATEDELRRHQVLMDYILKKSGRG